MNLEQFKSKAVLSHPRIAIAEEERAKGKTSGYIEKYNLYTYKGLEYHECIYPHRIMEYYVSLGEEIPSEIFGELLGELD